jgi:CRISPR system Cascade subunit CasA
VSAAAGFNLIDEPWIVVLGRDGRQQNVSLLDALGNSHDYTALGGEVPTQVFAITRLLLAFLHRAIDGPATKDEWAALWEADRLPMDQISAYAERVRHRFDLFDPTVPFYQVADLRTAKNDAAGLERIVADVPTGELLFTTRSGSNLRRISAAEAARWLVHVHAFDPSGIKSGALGDPTVNNGKGYPIGPGWCGQLGGLLLQGADLRETLLLNLIGRDSGSYASVGGERDLPAWERKPDTAAWAQRPAHGAIDLYTWQTRRVRLVGDNDGVTAVVLANGDKITAHNQHPLEPMSAWQHSDNQSKKLKSTVYMPRLHDPARAVWRGIAAILPSTASRHGGGGAAPQRYLAPASLQWISDLAAQGVLPERLRPGIRVTGAEYGSQQATFAEIVDDDLPVPLLVLREDHPAAGRAASEAVTDAEETASQVWLLAENIAQAAGAEPKTGSGDAARESFYAVLDGPYRSWLSVLGDQDDLAAARDEWRRTLRRAARTIADQVIAGAAPAAWTGRLIRDRLVNVARAEVWFTAALRRILPTTAESPKTAANTPPKEAAE